MRMLFTSTPLFGHFMPMLPLIGAAVQAGHDVIVATGPDLADEVDRRGLRLWQVGPSTAEVFDRRAALPEMPGATQVELLRRDVIAIFGWPGYQRARELTPLAVRWRPDVVVHEAADYAGWEVSAATGALSVAHGYGPHQPHTLELIKSVCSGAVDELGTPDRLNYVLASLYVDPWPPALRGDEPSPWTDVVGVRPEPRQSDSITSLPAEVIAMTGQPMLYVTFGTVFGSAEALTMVIEAVRGLPCHVVATTGPTLDPAGLGPVPDNVLVASFLPQNLVLEHCAAVVSHAGSGTVLGALAAHLPQVCLPLGADQFINAEQVARCGAGIAIPPDARDVGSIRRAVEVVLSDDSYASRAAAVQAEIDTMTPAAEVLTSIERRAADRVSTG
jgi:UDP:flavonoid glycosyltransferase YjiC (YdhE family)